MTRPHPVKGKATRTRKPETVLRELAWYVRHWTKGDSRVHSLMLELRRSLRDARGSK